MGEHIFVDETKARAFILVAVRVDNRDVARLRRGMRGLLMPGQERIHFTKERDKRRRVILAELAQHRLQVLTITSKHPDHGLARAKCLNALVELVARANNAHIVVEVDDSLAAQDARLLARAMQRLSLHRQVSFELASPRQDSGLWAADAIAWAVNRRGDWLRRIAMHAIERRDL
jgi:hypothetical protein